MFKKHREKLNAYLGNDIGIDLGTANTLVYLRSCLPKPLPVRACLRAARKQVRTQTGRRRQGAQGVPHSCALFVKRICYEVGADKKRKKATEGAVAFVGHFLYSGLFLTPWFSDHDCMYRNVLLRIVV